MNKSVIFLVPLVFQQAAAIESFTALKVKAFCGEMGVDFWGKDQWLKEFEDHHVLVMTHQIYLDLIQHRKYGFCLSQANLLVFDECHHANKNHAFKKIMDCFGDRNQGDPPQVLGLTASVVGKKVQPHQIEDEIKKLERTMRSVCKTASDPDVVEKYGAKPEVIMRTYSTNHLDHVAVYLEDEFRFVLDPLDAFLKDIKVLKDASGSGEAIKRELVVAKGAVRECLSALEDIGIWAANEVSVMLVDDLG
jgi:ERCC4-related helicase